MKRFPIIATVLVTLAIAVMIGLGFWQLSRLKEKEAALDSYRSNLHRTLAAYPAHDPADATYLFRTLSGYCLRVTSWATVGGHMPDGRPGWRHIASCATGAEGPGMIVDMGMSADPQTLPTWNGGKVQGIATQEPGQGSALIRAITGGAPARLMIVSDHPAQGLVRSPGPDITNIPNNHFAYAVQWFLFAAVAAVIYGIALVRRMRAHG